MSDLTIQFDDLPIIHINGMTAATVDGAADIEMGNSPRDWKVVHIRLNGWVPNARKRSFVNIEPNDNWFLEIANAIIIDLALGAAIEKELTSLYGKPSAYDKARDAREAA